MLNLEVDDIETAVDALIAADVEPVRYDGFDQDARGISRGIARNEGPDIAWITDPAGNIVSVLQNPPAGSAPFPSSSFTPTTLPLATLAANKVDDGMV